MTTLGERVAMYRRQRGLSQRKLGDRVRRSESWVSQVERNVQPVERLSLLQDLAMALGVTVADLRPEALPDADFDDAEPGVNDLDAVRLALSGHPALERLFVPSTTDEHASNDLLDQELERTVDHVWHLAHASQFADLSKTLTVLIPRLEQAARATDRTDDERRRLHALCARAYQAAAAAFARQDEPDAAWVAADRAITAAELAGDPLDVIAGHFRLAHAFLRLRRFDQAERVTTRAIDALRPLATDPSAPPELLSLYGAMHLVQAVVSGHEGDRSAAHAHLQFAKDTAERLGEDRNDFNTEFGPTNVQLHAVAVAVDLGDAGEALDLAQHVDASRLSPERQARFLIDVARAHTQRRHIGEATTALIKADRLAPEHVRAHHHARSTLNDLLAQTGPRPSADLLALAQRAGLRADETDAGPD
jgi:transcriptional regulator with XRE-family HTH domain